MQKKKNSRSFQRTLTYIYMQKVKCPKCKRILGGKATTKKNGNSYFYYYCNDCKNIDPNVELEEYELGIIYVYTNDKSLIKNKDDIFKYIPDKCEQNIIYTKNPKPIEIKVKPVIYEKGEKND